MRTRRKTSLAAAVAMMLATLPAAADVTKAQCVDANTNAQSLRRDGRLADARAMLAVCGDPQCPALVRDDCTRQLDEVNAAQPTVVFDVKDGRGADVTAVQVGVDGHGLEARLDGTPIPMDPGTHAFTFVIEGQPPVTETIVLREAEKSRLVHVIVGAPVVVPLAVDKDPPAAATHGNGRRTLGIAGMVLGGAGVVVGSLFGVLAASAWSSAKSECGAAQSCTSHDQAVTDRAHAITDGTAATVGLVAGTALFGGGLALFLSAGPRVSVSPELGPSSASFTLRGRF